MSTPEWFAEFDTRDMLFDPTIRAALSHFDDLAPTKRELLIALLELARAFGAQEGVREVRDAIAVSSI